MVPEATQSPDPEKGNDSHHHIGLLQGSNMVRGSMIKHDMQGLVILPRHMLIVAIIVIDVSLIILSSYHHQVNVPLL